ncbi:hypothetical protein EQG49_06425 [Periweissella cryptocerci]|uniref:Uncharacterized protein n=1 Tax=Periweissella cryptocerci TaxID=2506420 RepID=A0A4P6YTN2_9LACO|nr:hypothetical protein [Periweissella cryptocerci]QBO36118.1 hypothetical protein EQG49_06425 [Periweissella cryptocerci]
MNEIQNLKIAAESLAEVDRLIKQRTTVIRTEKAASKVQRNTINFIASVVLAVIILGLLSPKLFQVFTSGEYSLEEIIRVYVILFVIVAGFIVINFFLLLKRYALGVRKIVAKQKVITISQTIFQIEQQVAAKLVSVEVVAKFLPENMVTTAYLEEAVRMIEDEGQPLLAVLSRFDGKKSSRTVYQREQQILHDIGIGSLAQDQINQNIENEFLN